MWPRAAGARGGANRVQLTDSVSPKNVPKAGGRGVGMGAPTRSANVLWPEDVLPVSETGWRRPARPPPSPTPTPREHSQPR